MKQPVKGHQTLRNTANVNLNVLSSKNTQKHERARITNSKICPFADLN